MLRRIQQTGMNVTVLVVSILVFIIAFVIVQGVAKSQIPPTAQILSATRDLNVGDTVGLADIAVRTVYVDENTSLYIPQNEQDGLVGGIVAIPIRAGQPIFRDTVLAPTAENVRLSAILAKYPGYGIFPLPLDASNIISPNADSFLPGDLVDITMVISSRPKGIDTPTPQASYYYNPLDPNVIAPTPTAIVASEEELRKQAEEAKSYPPLAKNLAPEGLRVLAVQGLPADTVTVEDQQNQAPAEFIDYTKPKILLLLAPFEKIEILALALQEGDQVIVSLLGKGSDAPSTGFTYWDLEELFRNDRNTVLGNGE